MKIRRMIATAATMGALTLGLALPTTGTANASAPEKVTFTWNGFITSGDCEIMRGATWTLFSDGRAQFDGTVSSTDGNDAWLMRAQLLDGNSALLGEIRVSGSTSTKFVKNLPRAWSRYRWFAQGRFDPSLFPLIERMSLRKHC
ncbi:DUF6294 family protein [Nonomuraea basaltis]|uniref:DUF6294 family protein n=1 Tax=Nonomuraea basaltis TaxID=2495887 RepID=UPI00110C4D9F|nr:DUF6294 family protein [Nonomuraea basaltis]TMR88587.1 hypothetical protein EJK15_65395 [Nonomuraea basaltis]